MFSSSKEAVLKGGFLMFRFKCAFWALQFSLEAEIQGELRYSYFCVGDTTSLSYCVDVSDRPHNMFAIWTGFFINYDSINILGYSNYINGPSLLLIAMITVLTTCFNMKELCISH
jgi:hypothetical protein